MELLTDGMAAVYAEPRVKGLIFYELMDEPAISDPVEAYCGLVGGTETGDVTARKPSTPTYRKRLAEGRDSRRILSDRPRRRCWGYR